MSLNLIAKPEIYQNYLKVLETGEAYNKELLISAFPTYKSSWDYFTGDSEEEYPYYVAMHRLLSEPEYNETKSTEITSIDQASTTVNSNALNIAENMEYFFEWLKDSGFETPAYFNKTSTQYTLFLVHDPKPKRIRPDKGFFKTIDDVIKANNMENNSVFEIKELSKEFRCRSMAESDFYSIKQKIQNQANTAKTFGEIKVRPDTTDKPNEEEIVIVSNYILDWAISSGFVDAKIQLIELQNTYPSYWTYELQLA
ncbi:hypothetical protein PWKp18_00216 [Klebsiella phage PWKp18]|nr:hypothetical protein PWKp18_00216 [Klebsiella phage PWKp18]